MNDTQIYNPDTSAAMDQFEQAVSKLETAMHGLDLIQETNSDLLYEGMIRIREGCDRVRDSAKGGEI